MLQNVTYHIIFRNQFELQMLLAFNFITHSHRLFRFMLSHLFLQFLILLHVVGSVCMPDFSLGGEIRGA